MTGDIHKHKILLWHRNAPRAGGRGKVVLRAMLLWIMVVGVGGAWVAANPFVSVGQADVSVGQADVSVGQAVSNSNLRAGNTDLEHRQLHRVFDSWGEYLINTDPFTAASRGDRSANALLPDAGLEALRSRRNFAQTLLQELDELDHTKLNTQDQISRRLFQRQLRETIEEFDLGGHRLPLDGWWDYHATFAEQPVQMPFHDLTDYAHYIARMEAFPRWNQQYIDRLRAAIEQGWVRPQVVLDNYIASVEALLTSADESRFMEPMRTLIAQGRLGSEAERQALFQRAHHVVENQVLVAYAALVRFLREEYQQAATQTIGISALEGGMAYYEHLVRHFTTLDITADDIHQIGLTEVARIRAEMDVVIEQTGFVGDFAHFIEYLRTDPRFYASSPEELLRHTALVLKRMDGELPRFFGRLPRTPYGIREIPAYMAPRMTTAYYSRAPQDGSRAGFYYVNTWNLPARPLYEVEALSFHEAVPGHHLQIALQQELTDLPAFRQSGGFTVFVEGWALYSEFLALEMGFYEDPYSNFGRLTYEMWRALRLVVDTGIHAKGWSRERAITYMAENSALTLVNIHNEVDRYIFWPGQALAYKTGEIKIRQLRSHAESELAANFDIRAFHDVVLGNGAVTLEVLEEIVTDWVGSQKRQSTNTPVQQSLNTPDQQSLNTPDQQIIEQWLAQGYALGEVSVEDLITFYGRKQHGIPYVAGLLEIPPLETLVVTLQGSDCVLYVEHTLALAVTTLQGSTRYEDFTDNLTMFRYYDGTIDGYASRQHYFSDWLRSNQDKGLLEIIFQNDARQRRLTPLAPLTFMRNHRQNYRQLAASDSLYARITSREDALNALPPLYFIPQDRIRVFESELQTGDIIGFVSTIDGLDIAHTALVKRDGNRVGFYHASTTGSVIEDPKTIAQYTLDRRNVKGIIVARLLRPSR